LLLAKAVVARQEQTRVTLRHMAVVVVTQLRYPITDTVDKVVVYLDYSLVRQAYHLTAQDKLVLL
jgi:hypothetical protein